MKLNNNNRLELLVSTMHQTNYDLTTKMNIKSNAIIINQTNNVSYDLLENNDSKIHYYNFSERGIGLSRNSSLMRSQSEINILIDDDFIFYDDYVDLILNEFDKKENRKIDIIIFNYENKPKRYDVKKPYKVGFRNYMRFGGLGIAFRRKSVVNKRIFFSLDFGGGTNIGSGEDTIFIRDCLKNKLRILYVPTKIGVLIDDRNSTWFDGYNEKFFIDKGKLFYTLSKKFYWLYCVKFALSYRKKYKFSKSLKLLISGVKGMKNEA